MTTIDDGADIPNFIRLQPTAREVTDMEMELVDPLRVVARNIRGLRLEDATKMAEQMGDIALRDKLNKWAVAYLDGGELPLKAERRL